MAPLDLAEKSLDLIAREAEHARHGRPARIIVKMNSLLDKNIIQELYRASQAGVEIDLIVRGICGLRPGVRGVSDRIRVRSIVGRFLEHSRIFYFANGGEEEIYLGSADWMPRNLYERVEVTFPVKDPMLRQRIRSEILEAYLRDTAKARLLRADGSYVAAEAAGRRRRLQRAGISHRGGRRPPERGRHPRRFAPQRSHPSERPVSWHDRVLLAPRQAPGTTSPIPRRMKNARWTSWASSSARCGPRAGGHGVRVDAIISSPLKRATQTASLVANEIGYDGKLQRTPALRPDAQMEAFRELLERQAETWRR